MSGRRLASALLAAALPTAAAASLADGAWDARLDSGQAGAQGGYAVAGAGDVDGDGDDDVIVGARFYDAGQPDEGAVFLFHGGPGGIASASPAGAAAALESDQSDARFGWNVAGAGDVNGDGDDDVLVGAFGYDVPDALDAGGAYVFLGGPGGIADGGTPATAHARIEGDQVDGRVNFGAGVGDLDGDGYDDLAVAAHFYDAGQTDEGAVFLFHGSASGIAGGGLAAADTVIEADEAGALLGYGVAAAGDVDGDGWDDLILGAPLHDAGATDAGAAFVFRGGPAGIASGGVATADWVLASDQPGSHFGYDVGGAGDVNGDGYADVIVGARFYETASSDGGAAFVFHGGPAGVGDRDVGEADARIEAEQDGAWLGQSVAGAGDVNGDGYDDVLAGGIFYDGGEIDEGVALLFAGGPGGIAGGGPDQATLRLEVDEPGAGFGVSVGSAGDVDGDGVADAIVGAYLYGEPDAGAAFVYLPEPGLSAALAGAALVAALGAAPVRKRPTASRICWASRPS